MFIPTWCLRMYATLHAAASSSCAGGGNAQWCQRARHLPRHTADRNLQCSLDQNTGPILLQHVMCVCMAAHPCPHVVTWRCYSEVCFKPTRDHQKRV